MFLSFLSVFWYSSVHIKIWDTSREGKGHVQRNSKASWILLQIVKFRFLELVLLMRGKRQHAIHFLFLKNNLPWHKGFSFIRADSTTIASLKTALAGNQKSRFRLPVWGFPIVLAVYYPILIAPSLLLSFCITFNHKYLLPVSCGITNISSFFAFFFFKKMLYFQKEETLLWLTKITIIVRSNQLCASVGKEPKTNKDTDRLTFKNQRIKGMKEDSLKFCQLKNLFFFFSFAGPESLLVKMYPSKVLLIFSTHSHTLPSVLCRALSLLFFNWISEAKPLSFHKNQDKIQTERREDAINSCWVNRRQTGTAGKRSPPQRSHILFDDN